MAPKRMDILRETLVKRSRFSTVTDLVEEEEWRNIWLQQQTQR